MKKQFPLIGIISAIQSGIPLLKDAIGLFKKHPKTPEEVLNTMSQSDLINHVKNIEAKDEKSLLIRFGNLIITALTVYGVVWTAKHFGVTYQDIIDLFGLIK